MVYYGKAIQVLVDRVRPADCAGGRLRQAEVAHLARLHELTDGAGDVLDRHIGVDAVLVEQVDRVGAQPAQRGIGDALDLLGAAVEPDQPAGRSRSASPPSPAAPRTMRSGS